MAVGLIVAVIAWIFGGSAWWWLAVPGGVAIAAAGLLQAWPATWWMAARGPDGWTR